MQNKTKSKLGWSLSAGALAVSALTGVATSPAALAAAPAATQDYTISTNNPTGNDNAFYTQKYYDNLTVNKGVQLHGANAGLFIQYNSVGNLTIQEGASLKGREGLWIDSGLTGHGLIQGATIEGSDRGVTLAGHNKGTLTIRDTTVKGREAVWFNYGVTGNLVIDGKSQVNGSNIGVMVQNGNIGEVSVGKDATVTGQNYGVWLNRNVGHVTLDGQVTGVKGDGVTFLGGTRLKGALLVHGHVLGGNNGISVYNGMIGADTQGEHFEVLHGASVEGQKSYGIYVDHASQIKGSIDVEGGRVTGGKGGILNEGTIWAANTANGISVAEGGYVSSIINRGKIVGSRHGINIQNPNTKVDSVVNRGTIDATQTPNSNGIFVQNHAQVGSIQNAGTVKAGEFGILSNASRVGQITNSGVVEGKDAGIYNVGTLGADNNKDAALVLADTSQVSASKGWAVRNDGTIHGSVALAGQLKGASGSFYNQGTITNGVTFNGTKDISITNVGNIHGVLTANGTGKVVIKNWLLHDHEDKVNVVGEHAKNVVIEKVTYGDAESTAHAAATHTGIEMGVRLLTQTASIDTDDANLSNDVQRLGFTSTFDHGAQVLDVGLTSSATAGGILGQTIANQTMRRDFFVDSMVEEAVQSAQYHASDLEGNGSVFVKPYGSHDGYHVGGADLSGNTYGVLAGVNYTQDDLGVTAFAGYENSNLDAQYADGSLGVKSDAFYLGATGYANVAHFDEHDLFVKLGAKAGFTRHTVDRAIDAVSSQANANTMNWGLKAQVGLNLNLSKSTIVTPTLGLGYSSASVNDFGLMGKNEYDHYNLNNVVMPYGEVGLNWHQSWTDKIRTNIGTGVRVLFDKNQSLTSTFTNTEGQKPAGVPTSIGGNYDLSSSYEYVTTNATWAVNKNNEVTLGYTGVFSNAGQSHNLTAKYEYLF